MDMFRFAGGQRKVLDVGQLQSKLEIIAARVLRGGDDTIRKSSFFDTDARFRWQLDSCQSFLRHVSLQKAHTLSSNTATRGQYIKRLA
jgi:hypothetical protein